MDRDRQTFTQNTEHGRAVVQSTRSYQESMRDLTPVHVYPQLENIRENDRQSDEQDLGIDQASASGTGTSSGISIPTNTSTTNSIDDVNSYMQRLSVRSSSFSTASSPGTSSDDAEDPHERRKVPEMRLRDLSTKLGYEWEKLASFLGFGHVDIQRFKYNASPLMENQIFYMLTIWRCLQSNRATSRKLGKALEKSGRKDLADELLGNNAQAVENRPSAKRVPNQMFNNLLMSLTELTEKDREKLVFLIRQDDLGDGAVLTPPDGKTPTLLKLIECLEVHNYLDANNVWYLQYLLYQLGKKELYEKVWKYAVRRFKKYDTLYLHEPSSVPEGNNTEVRFKVIGKVEHFGDMHLEEFRAMLTTKFDGEVRHISRIGAREGCIELIFQIPLSYKTKLMIAAQEKAEWLFELNVMSVKVKGEDLIVLQTETDDDQTAELSKEMLLLLAIIEHDKQEMEQLLTDGACPNYKVGGKWLLQWAIFMDQEKEDKEEFVQLLLEHGADRDAKDEMGMTAVKEAAFLGRCRQALTFEPKKPAHTYFKKQEAAISILPKLTADNLQLHTVFSWEKRQFVCLPCRKIWQELVWGIRPLSSCRRCHTQYYAMMKGRECPRRRVKCKHCDLVFTTFRHPYIPKHCRYCHNVVVDCPPQATSKHEKTVNVRRHSPLIGAKFLEAAERFSQLFFKY